MGVCTIVACSDEAFQGMGEENESPEIPVSANSFNNDDSGHAHGDNPLSGIIWAGKNYASPWDIWFKRNSYGTGNLQPSYMVNNGNAENVTNYNIEIFAYAGLAYFDSDDDGIFYDVSQPPTFPGAPGALIADMAANPGGYPNLYANGHEVGNLVRTVVPLRSDAYPSPTHSFRVEDQFLHLPMAGAGGTNRYPQYPQWWQPFDFTGAITPQEDFLLREYGKIFFYEVNVFDAATNAFVGTFIMHPEIENLTGNYNPEWTPVTDMGGNHLQGDAPTLGMHDLYYYKSSQVTGTVWDPMDHTNDLCDSREVVFFIPQNLHEIPIPGGLNTLKLGIAQSSRYLWLNSALTLVVE